MKSTLDILTELSGILEVPELTNELTGLIYIGDMPDTSQKEDVTINSLSNLNQYVQSGFINLNVYLRQVQGGRADVDRFKTLIDIIIPLVIKADANGYHFQIGDDKGIFKDQDRDGMYFYNLRLEFQTI